MSLVGVLVGRVGIVRILLIAPVYQLRDGMPDCVSVPNQQNKMFTCWRTYYKMLCLVSSMFLNCLYLCVLSSPSVLSVKEVDVSGGTMYIPIPVTRHCSE